MVRMEVFLIIIVLAMAVLSAVGVALLMIKFGHPDDKNVAKFPKIITFLGLWLTFASVLIMPYDVANTKGNGGGVRVDILWQILYITLAVLAFGLIPFAVFFYESNVDPEQAKKGKCCASQISQALCYSSIFFVVFSAILLIMYAFLGTAEVPVEKITVSASQMVPVGSLQTFESMRNPLKHEVVLWFIPVTMPIFCMAMLSFFGWFGFTFFVGVGLIALPFDLINEFRTRPTPMSTRVWVDEKENLAKRAAGLIEIGTKFKEMLEKADPRSRSEARADKKNFLKFEQNYYFLKKDYTMLDLSYRLKGGNPLWYIMKLVLGIIGSIVSLTWLIHICIFLLPTTPIHPFLNNYFVELEQLLGQGFPLFGICAYATWSFYLLWACVKGNFKLGLRFLFWKIYPMEINNTLMNAFLVNTWLLLLCSVPAVQFCTQSFPIYARYTEVDMLFGTQIQNLRFFSYFWQNNVFVIAMMAMSFLTLIALFVSPTDASANIDKEIAKISRKSNMDL